MTRQTVREFIQGYKGFDWYKSIVIVDQRGGFTGICKVKEWDWLSEKCIGIEYAGIIQSWMNDKYVYDFSHTENTMLIVL
jgi:hypothetical protein